MEYKKLGRTGLDVSRICLGCMSYGGGNQGNHAWSLGEEESRPFIKRALEAGINFFDTANRYSLGNSEEILGRAIRDFARREEIVIATKVYGRIAKARLRYRRQPASAERELGSPELLPPSEPKRRYGGYIDRRTGVRARFSPRSPPRCTQRR
jgi:aryl-alcohol dehydrogenase-like predicted oxidoreductase